MPINRWIIKYKNVQLIILIIFTGILVLVCDKNSDVLAMYNGGVVTVDEFLNNYQNYLKLTGVQDNMSSRKLILDKVINEEIILSEFKKNTLDKSIEFIENKNIIFEQLLLNNFYKQRIFEETQFSDKQLRDYFTLENTLFHIKQIFAETYNEADEYFELLESGISFEELISIKNIPDVNFDLGFIKLNDVHPRFRKILQNLDVGEISGPLRGDYGYSVIKIEEKRVRPLLTEYEFAKQKRMLNQKMAIEYSDSLQSSCVLKLKNEMNIEWEEANLPYLYDILSKMDRKSDLPVSYDTQGRFSETVCTVGEISYNYYSLLPLLLKSKDEHIKAIRDVNSLKDFITGILVREQLLSQAKVLGLDKQIEFLQQFKSKNAKLQIDTWTKSFADTVLFSESDYHHYYDENNPEFTLPVRRKVYEICTPTETLAKACIHRYETGKSFQEIAREFSQYHQHNSADGLLGILSSGELGKFGTAIFSASLGDIVGPYCYDDKYLIFLSTEEYESQALSLQEAKPIIEKKRHQELVYRKMKKYFDKQADVYHVIKNLQILKSIKYQDVGIKGGYVLNG